MKITDYVEALNLELELKYNYSYIFPWSCRVINAEYKDNEESSILKSKITYGSTVNEALDRLAKYIRGKIIIINATGEKRMEFLVPNNMEG